jgi:hypothetical protein
VHLRVLIINDEVNNIHLNEPDKTNHMFFHQPTDEQPNPIVRCIVFHMFIFTCRAIFEADGLVNITSA